MDRKRTYNLISVLMVAVILAVALCCPFSTINAYAEANLNSPVYSAWHLAEGEQYGLNVRSLWDYIKGKTSYNVANSSSTVVVAVIDSGIDVNQPFFKGALWTNNKESKNGADDDNNGVIDDINGVNFTAKSDGKYTGDISDSMTGGTASQYWHGTHVSGIVRSVVPNVKIMPLKAGVKDGKNCNFDATSVVNAIIYAVNHGANVINLSFGTKKESFVNEKVSVVNTSTKYSIIDAINYAISQNVLVVAAQGNDGEKTKFYPASCEGVVSVMASDDKGRRWSSSNYLETASLSAPGVEILSTIGVSSTYNSTTPKGYGYKNGTSMSAPYVSGVAALLMSVTGIRDGEIIKKYITDTSLLSTFDFNNSLGNKNLLLDNAAVKKMLDKLLDEENTIIPDDVYKKSIECYDNKTITLRVSQKYDGEPEWYNNGVNTKNVGPSYTFKPSVNTIIEVRVNGIIVETYTVTVKSYASLVLGICLGVGGGIVVMLVVGFVAVKQVNKKKISAE